MAKNIEPNLKLISEYLKLKKNENFIIPEYQRGYTWSITQCDKLWQDLEAFIASDANDPYFFGTIIVDCSITDKFSLIDGQQRTTSFLLLLKALLINLNSVIKDMPDDEESESLKAGLIANRNKIMKIIYKADDEEIPAMLKDTSKTENILILENNSINELHTDETAKIISSNDYETAEKNTFKYKKRHKDNQYSNHFRNFKFFYDKIKDKSESELNLLSKIFLEKCQVIEIRSWQIEQAITMFNSLNSTGLPLSDADIISAQLYSKSGKDKSHFNKLWEDIKESTDDLNQRKIVDIDGILQQYMYIVRAENKVYFKDGSVDVTTPGLRRYYTEINSSLLNNSINFSEALLKLITIWKVIRDYPVVKLLLKGNENSKLYLIAYLNRFDPDNLTESEVTEVSECLLRLFAIIEVVDLGFSSSKFKTFLFKEIINLVDQSVGFETIFENIDKHIKTNWNFEEIKLNIENNEKHFLVYLNEYLLSKEQKLKFKIDESLNIEHIMPQSGRNNKAIQIDANISDIEEFESLVNKLGNKILLEENVNKSLGQEWFKSKCQNSVKEKRGYKDSQFPMANQIVKLNKNTWQKDDILQYTDIAAKRIADFIFNN